ncbi:hypothetical protein C9374_006635 [Naegleria lovaniensis]|uniref:Nucleolar complex protein 3 homolog n=1 Tax=Naegleria lovaniensis TaxID=51637 RepID=A0AA88GJ39_NAELO|nr:uncharacterized protein C9374_006635 [Naegleria lovaniensis]KAG2379518.1 hypothetical protein C9374_006635 [Naegleria lovaniensis]
MGKPSLSKQKGFSKKSQRGGNKAVNMQHKRKTRDAENEEDVHLSDLDEADFEFAERMSSLASLKDSDFDINKKKKKKTKFDASESEIMSDDDSDAKKKVSEDADDVKVKQLEENYSKTRLGRIVEKAEKVLEQNEKEESQTKVKMKLPIKGEDGVIQKQVQVLEDEKQQKKGLTKQAKKDKKEQQKKKNENDEQEEDEIEEEDEIFDSLYGKIEEKTEETEQQKETKKQEKLRLRQILNDPVLRDKRRQQLSVEIGSTASSILEIPDMNLAKISRIYDLCMDGDVYVKKLAVLSMCALFKDLLPDYKINLEAAGEGTRFSKEVKSRRSFESNILKYYQKYVQFIEKHAKTASSKIQFIASKCLSELLVHRPYFNFTRDIISIVVPLLDSKNDQVREIVAENISLLFSNDTTKGATTLDVVEEIATLITKKKYEVSPTMFDVFLSLKLKTALRDKVLPDTIVNRKKNKKNKKKAKDLSEHEELQRELKEAQGSTSSEVRKIQTDILRNVIVCYVRVLKQQPESPIVFSALAGLAKFSHLMNVDLLYSLLDYMKALLESAENVNELVQSHLNEDEIKHFKPVELPVRTVLQTLITTARLLSGIGGAIDIDPKEFYTQLYNVVDRVITTQYDETNFRLLVDALVLLLLKPVKVPLVRVAAFIKKMCCYCFTTHIHVTVCFLEIIRELFIKYPSAKQMLSGEESGIGSYSFDETVPDSTTPFASPLFELSQLQTHYHPQLQFALDGIRGVLGIMTRYQQSKAKEELKQMTCDDYQQILSDYTPFSGILKPPVQAPLPHPLQEKLERLAEKKNNPDYNKKKKQKIQEKQIYVTPSMVHMRSAFAQECLEKSSKLL